MMDIILNDVLSMQMDMNSLMSRELNTHRNKFCLVEHAYQKGMKHEHCKVEGMIVSIDVDDVYSCVSVEFL